MGLHCRHRDFDKSTRMYGHPDELFARSVLNMVTSLAVVADDGYVYDIWKQCQYAACVILTSRACQYLQKADVD